MISNKEFFNLRIRKCALYDETHKVTETLVRYNIRTEFKFIVKERNLSYLTNCLAYNYKNSRLPLLFCIDLYSVLVKEVLQLL
jgi:hypothetical protein